MAKGSAKKQTTVHEHPLHVPVSEMNPEGLTTRHTHLRRLKVESLNAEDINLVFQNYDRSDLIYPTANKLSEYPNADKYDKVIAVWTDYFNKKFEANPPLDPDVVKALIGSESSFNPNPPGNRQIAVGIAQITRETLKLLQDPGGEAKDFLFRGIRLMDLKDPSVSIPLAVRWLFRKRETAASKLKRPPNPEELILEYKGLLKSKSEYKVGGLKNFKEKYDALKK